MDKKEPSFFDKVYLTVGRIPCGRVVSYGQIARMHGRPRAAREVGWAMANCPDDLPWQRVVRADGSIAGGEHSEVRRALLREEGVPFLHDGRVDMDACAWDGGGETIFVVCAIIFRDGKMLAAQRGYGDYAGWWEFPGGKVETGEEPEDALVREIREELGAEISVDRYFDTTEYDYEKFYLVMRCYLCTLADAGGEISLLEHSAAKWVSRGNVRKLKWLAADLPVIEKLIEEGIL